MIFFFIALWLASLIGLMHSVSQRANHWLAACFLSALGYVALSLRLDTSTVIPIWLDGLRWALFSAALYSFVRYRLGRRQQS